MIETALYIVGVGLCVITILFLLGIVLQIVKGVLSFAWDMIDPNGPMRGGRR